jgi:hypothetical protein
VACYMKTLREQQEQFLSEFKQCSRSLQGRR